jgi:hypothetical protein
MNWYLSLDANRFTQSQQECVMNLYVMQQAVQVMSIYDKEAASKGMQQLGSIVSQYQSRGGQMPQQ